ncbi:MAG: hypothetical protein Fur002_17610 [Anaerolineales bacterium]
MNKREEKQFQDLLLRFAQETQPETRRAIEETLWTQYGIEQAIFVLDMSGFSLLTRKHGIVHYLSMVRRMQLMTQPIIESYNGMVVKFEADNCFAVFPDTLPAAQAAIAIQLALGASNILTPNDLDIYVSCGIDYGKILMVESKDFFGEAVNKASKLGEDIAAAGEILVTREAMQRVPPEAQISWREVNLSIAGMSIPACSIEYRS